MDDCPPLEPTDTEWKLIRAAACGDEAVICDDVENPSEHDWQPEHEVRAELIRTLALGLRDDWPVDPRGLRLRGARVTGELDLENGGVGCALELVGCSFDEAPNLRRTVTKVLRLTGSHVPGLAAYGLTVDGHLDLDRGFRCEGEADLLDATIGGSLGCHGGTFTNPDGNALSADRVQVTGSVFLRGGFAATGEVRLLGATIGGNLECVGGTFTNPDGAALSADGLRVTGSVLLRGGFAATGEVRLLGATIGGNLDCDGGTFTNPDGAALYADRVRVTGSVFLRGGFEATGEVRLLGATIGGELDCDGGTFTNPDGAALSADRVRVTGSVFLSGGFASTGAVRLLGATIGGDLSCGGGTFANPDGDAVSGDGSRIDGHVFLWNVDVDGTLGLHSAQVGRDLQIVGAKIVGRLNLDHAVVGGAFAWLELRETAGLEAEMSHLAVGQLHDDAESWERVTALTLTGFRYDEISERATLTPDERLAWVAQPERFSPQPYEQLAKVLRESGRPAQARKVAKGKEDALRTRGDLRPPLKAWNWFLGKTVGHGYELWRPLVIIAALLVAGTLVLSLPGARRAIVPAADNPPVASAEPGCVDGYPCYQPFVFALDALLPIVDLEQDGAWRVTATLACGAHRC